ncbi:MAG TPA: hypothetical protein ENK32_07440 [Anaerolineae bacterium]|nr:hypothetical protein [Anaerolineae bacterium]
MTQEIDVNVIEIRDPALNEAQIRQKLREQMAGRLAAGGYRPDAAALGPESLRDEEEDTAVSPALTEYPGLNELMIQLMAQEPLREVQFTSPQPVVGPFIAAIRRAWNWMSTKWYVRPLIRQQNDINRQTGLLLNEMLQWQEINARQIADLQKQVAALEAALENAKAN